MGLLIEIVEKGGTLPFIVIMFIIYMFVKLAKDKG
jgi:hypothetical protein